jgi:thiaminase
VVRSPDQACNSTSEYFRKRTYILVRLEKDKLQIADMDYVVKAYLEYLYRVDQASRSKDIEAALRLMVPGPGQEVRAISQGSKNRSDPTRTAMERHMET